MVSVVFGVDGLIVALATVGAEFAMTMGLLFTAVPVSVPSSGVSSQTTESPLLAKATPWSANSHPMTVQIPEQR